MSDPASKPSEPAIPAAPAPNQPAATAVTAPPPAAPAKPALPPRPAPPAKMPPGKGGTTRRYFLFKTWIGAAWFGLIASCTGMVLGTVRFLFPNVLSEPSSTFKAGPPEQYEEGKVDDRFKTVGAWVIRAKNERDQDTIYALSTTCTHLGCTPNWLEGEKKFKCPCHGSGFRITGVNFEGPAPRPLERYAIRLGDDGQIVVDKSRKFQKELGQWGEADSYILLG
ncbi:MAG TPA: ubiquinol-cytochrome c reductase iron-sulfur subunit [Gemmataceae bacterium]|nr:ubiquinol-cytochrome c reductase iron-sulfur subunit [Gemmataceae bacterium]